MTVWRSVLCMLALVACSDDSVRGPFDKLPQDAALTGYGLDGRVQVARDRYGVAHIHATTVGDAGFVQGYVMAHDRLAQMDLLRRFGAGTLAELFGALDPSVIDTDLEMRVHRMRPLAEATWQALQQSTDPTDAQIVALLQRFSDGVNAFVTDLRDEKWTLDPAVLESFDPQRFVAWTPVDSLVLGRFQAFALSWSTPFELDLDELYAHVRANFDLSTSTQPARVARKGISKDLLIFQPVGLVPTIDGFPNVTTDTGSSSDGSPRKRSVTGARPAIAQATYDRARGFFSRSIHTGAFGALGPHAFLHPFAGSNNWAVSPALTDGAALLATDQHLQLPNPSIFYPTHLIIENTNDPSVNLDVLGITFPGIPGVILGSNGKVAWSATVSEHDVNDLYRETIMACPAGSCVEHDGAQVPIEPFDETIVVGALGTETERFTVTYENVPHHGPLIPEIDRTTHRLVPRTATEALSVRYTGYEPSFEIRALWNLAHAANVDDGFRALSDFHFGSQNWTMIDAEQNIAWTTHAFVPDRAPAAYTWNAATNPNGAAPFFILDGRGGFDWVGAVSPRYVPHAKNPPQGYLATANADPVGATFDNDPLNQPVVDGHPLYVGVSYAAGVREERIATLIEQAPRPVTYETMAQIQHDTHSNVGAHLVPKILEALARLDTPTGAPADLAPYLASLSAADKARLATARGVLQGWMFATPVDGDGSAATAVFNAWVHFFLERALRDEFVAASFDMNRIDDNALIRIVYALLTRPEMFKPFAATGQPVVCDDFTSTTDDSCTTMILRAALDAVTYLESPQGFASADPAAWRWGQLHQLLIQPLFPNTALNLPRPGELATTGFPRAGDNFAINRADHGYKDLDFSQFADGPAQRFLAIANPGEPIAVKWQLPGGAIFDSRSPHYRDLLDQYYLPEQHFDAPFSIDQIVDSGEYRWDFQ
ncbi:MAG TPA: penicillin acylase family protein [Kofleriaceae bacterium]|nr:penicillin acylase family protein [Kofleriaceae bacterium]